MRPQVASRYKRGENGKRELVVVVVIVVLKKKGIGYC